MICQSKKSRTVQVKSWDTVGVTVARFTVSVKTQRSRVEQYTLVDMARKSDALVIGNGVSRLQFDLNQLQELFTTYGCNALYRDFIPDHLIAVDPYMIHEILNKDIHMKTKLHIQGHSQFDTHKLRQYYSIVHYGYKEGMDSGNTAILVACQQDHDVIYMIGTDYTVDNVYAGTQNYNPQSHHSLPPVWQTRITRLCKQYSDKKFIRVNGNNYTPNITCDNFHNITIEQFKETVNEL